MEKIPLVPPTVRLPPEELKRRLERGMELLMPLLLELAEKRLEQEEEAGGSSDH